MDKYAVKTNETLGCALFKYNREALMWQQVSAWYLRFANLYRFVIKPLGLVIGENCFVANLEQIRKVKCSSVYGSFGDKHK